MPTTEKGTVGLKEKQKRQKEYEAIEARFEEINGNKEKLSKVQITRLELMQRLDRNLIQGLRQLRKSRIPYTRISLGDYHIPDVHRNFVVEPRTTDDRMEEIARELGLLQKWEEVER